MSEDLDPVRRLRPDRLLPDDPPDPYVLAHEKNRLLSTIGGIGADAPPERETPSSYPHLAYADERAALEFLVRAFGFASAVRPAWTTPRDARLVGSGQWRRHDSPRRGPSPPPA